MPTTFEAIEAWMDKARAKLENGGISADDLDELAHILRGSHKTTRQRLMENPGDGILDRVPKLYQVYDHPKVRGALISLLGEDVQMNSHRHCHINPPGTRSQGWHQDGVLRLTGCGTAPTSRQQERITPKIEIEC